MERSLIETRRFYLRNLTLEDVTERYLLWLKDIESNRFIETARSENTIDSLQNYVKHRIIRDDVIFLGIFTKDTGFHIGNIKFEPIDLVNSSAIMGILIGDLDWHGKGVAVEVINSCADWLFTNYSIKKIYLGVDYGNVPAINAYLKAGFRPTKEGPFSFNDENGLKMIRYYTPALRLALGTVQFGMHYGVANQSGQVSCTEASAILQQAWGAGVGTLDTAIAYGESEQRLGEIGVKQWRVISKIPAVPTDCKNVERWLRDNVERSLSRLNISRLYGLLMHQSTELLESYGKELYAELLNLKKEGYLKKIGISIYDPEELDHILPKYSVDMIQAPFNILDRRLETSGWLTRLHAMGIEVHVRSVFLQGLLLMKAEQRPEKFCRWQSLWDQWDAWLQAESLTPLQACMGFVLSHPEIERVVFGVDNVKQLRDILSSVECNIPTFPATLMTEDMDLINPSRWNQL